MKIHEHFFFKNYYAKHGLISLFGRVLSLPSAILFNILLARILSPADYGVIGIVTQMIAFCLIFSMFGYRNIILKNTPIFLRTKDYNKLGNIISQSIITTTAISFLLYLILNLFSHKISSLYSIEKLKLVIPIFSVCLIFQTLNMNLAALLVAVKKVWQSNICERTIMNLFYVLTLIILTKTNFYFTLLNISYIYLIGKILTFISLFYFSYPIIRKIDFLHLKIKFENYLRLSFFFSSSELTLKIVTSVSPLIIGFFVDSEQIAYYYTAFLLANLASFFIAMINNLVANKIAVLYGDSDFYSILKLNKNIVKVLSLFSIIVTLAYLFFGKFILSFWGTLYVEHSYLLLLILVFGEFINSLGGATGLIISICDMERSGFIIILISAIINILLQIVLINFFGILGAAIATSFSVILYNFLKYYIVLKKFNKT